MGPAGELVVILGLIFSIVLFAIVMGIALIIRKLYKKYGVLK